MYLRDLAAAALEMITVSYLSEEISLQTRTWLTMINNLLTDE